MQRICEIVRSNSAALIVGVGGGKTLDTAKLCADSVDLPVIIVPTSASTDAPVSEIAVLYTCLLYTSSPVGAGSSHGGR